MNKNTIKQMVETQLGFYDNWTPERKQTRWNEIEFQEKINAYNAITTILVKTKFMDLIPNLTDLGLNRFWVEKTEFGDGYRVILQDPLKGKSYSSKGSDRYPQDAFTTPVRELFIKDTARILFRLDTAQNELVRKFKSSDELATFLADQTKKVYDSITLLFQQIMLKLFAEKTSDYSIMQIYGKLPAGNNSEDQLNKTALDEMIENIRKSWECKVEYDEYDPKSPKDLIKKIQDILLEVSQRATRRFNWGFNNVNKTEKQIDDEIEAAKKDNKEGTLDLSNFPLYNNISPSNILLIMNAQDVLNFNWADLTNLRQMNSTFAIPNIERITLPSVKPGTAYLIDPRTIQFSDLLSETYKDFNIFTLENHMVVHKWIRAGFIKYGFGVKIEYKKLKDKKDNKDNKETKE